MLNIYRLLHYDGKTNTNRDCVTVAFRIVSDDLDIMCDIDYRVFKEGVLRGVTFHDTLNRRVKQMYEGVVITTFSNWTTRKGDEFHLYPFEYISLDNKDEALDILDKIITNYGEGIVNKKE